MNTNTATEYRNLPLAVLTESTTNPRRIFEDARLRNSPQAFAARAFSLPCLCGPHRPELRDRRRSQTLPRRADGGSSPPSPSASSTSPTPRHWRRS